MKNVRSKRRSRQLIPLIVCSPWTLLPPNTIPHPAPFPEEIPYRLISLYSYPGDLVLDPFVGSGQTLKVAYHLGRCYVGYEVIPKYVALAEQRICEPLHLRQEQLIAVFEKAPLKAPSRTKPVRKPQIPLFDFEEEH